MDKFNLELDVNFDKELVKLGDFPYKQGEDGWYFSMYYRFPNPQDNNFSQFREGYRGYGELLLQYEADKDLNFKDMNEAEVTYKNGDNVFTVKSNVIILVENDKKQLIPTLQVKEGQRFFVITTGKEFGEEVKLKEEKISHIVDGKVAEGSLLNWNEAFDKETMSFAYGEEELELEKVEGHEEVLEGYSVYRLAKGVPVGSQYRRRLLRDHDLGLYIK